MAKDEGELFPGAKFGQPVPAEKAVARDDQILPIQFDEPEECSSRRGDLSVGQAFAVSIDDASVEGTCMEIDTGVVSMSLVVESHGGLLA